MSFSEEEKKRKGWRVRKELLIFIYPHTKIEDHYFFL